jgi:hypothetical protein
VGAAAGPTLGLLAVATLAAPGALAVPLAAETTTPAPSPSGAASTTGSATGTATGTSAAAEGYRFWGYYQQANGKWDFSQTGAFQVVPKDGTVDGWRFATAAVQDPRFPRALPSFDAICGKTAAEAGKKRVGVVIDYGRKADAGADVNPPAPIARCASVMTGASSAEVLNAVAGPREDKGMVCAIDNWPGSSGCGDPVATIPADAKTRRRQGRHLRERAAGAAQDPGRRREPAGRRPGTQQDAAHGPSPWWSWRWRPRWPGCCAGVGVPAPPAQPATHGTGAADARGTADSTGAHSGATAPTSPGDRHAEGDRPVARDVDPTA